MITITDEQRARADAWCGRINAERDMLSVLHLHRVGRSVREIAVLHERPLKDILELMERAHERGLLP